MLNRIAKKIYNQYRLSIIAKRVFDAALTDQQKSLTDEYTKKRLQGLTFGPMFSSDRTYFNLGKSNLSTIEMPQQIYEVIDKDGYYCPDYREGYVYKKDDKLKNKPVKLIKILKKNISDNQQFNMLKKQFDNRLGTSRKQMINCLMCITHNPYDVAGMSTDRNWSSCMNLNHGDDDTPLKQVQYGGMCAYLIQNGDKEIEKPIARIAIKRLEGDNGGFIFVAQNRIYGDEDFANQLNFMGELINILDESNKQTMNDEIIFERHDDNSYSDSNITKRYMFKDDDQLIKYFEKNENMQEDLIDKFFILKLSDYQLHNLFPYIMKYIDNHYQQKVFCLSRLIKYNKLTGEQIELVADILIKKHDTENLYWLINDNKLTLEQRKSAINTMIAIQDTKNLYDLIRSNLLMSEQRKQAIDLMIKIQDTEHLYWLIYDDKLTSEQRKSVVDFFIKKQDTENLYWLIKENSLTSEQCRLAFDLMIKKQDTYHLSQLIKHNHLTPEQIQQFNLSYLKN